MFIRFAEAALQAGEGTSAAVKNVYSETKRIVVGSHIDTVRNGGWLDGVYGVVAGLETMRTLSEDGTVTLPLELVNFAEEEGSNFGSTMTGSKFITGIYGEEELDKLRNDQGVSLRKMLQRCGFPEYKREEVVWDFEQVRAMLELHIEQGPVLERKGLSIGIVDVVYGMSVLEVTLKGVGNHAGATPMIDRRDALTAAALCISEAERIAKEDSEGITVATVGKISVSPNCSNVIPEEVMFTVEVRDKNEEKIHRTMDEIRDAIVSIAKQRGVRCETKSLAYSAPVKMEEKIIERIEELASRKGLSYTIMSSGAVHDTCLIAAHAPGGMIFVPSKGGRSHVPFEDTDEEDLVLGAQLLLDTILAI
jgi:hydantoinase/carbamoylase family amidase